MKIDRVHPSTTFTVLFVIGLCMIQATIGSADSASQQACVNALSQDPTQSFCAVETCSYRECIARHAMSIRAGDIVVSQTAPTTIPAECYPDMNVMQNCIVQYLVRVSRESKPATLTSGSHTVVVFAQGGPYNSTWKLTVSGTSVDGTSSWKCCPADRLDPISGTIDGDTVTIERSCTGQGADGPCFQVYTGKIQQDGIVGTFTHNGADGGSWRLWFAAE